mgnify:CR=1 FL=1
MNIPFNKPYISGNELKYIQQAVEYGKISGNGYFTKKCHEFFYEKYCFKKVLLTTSCTDALEMAAILSNVGPGDEVIVPSYTFVSTALAFVRQGANVVFVDSSDEHPNMDASKIEKYITERTKAIVPVHYAGHACDMDKIMELASKYNLIVIEDAAQAIDSYYFNNKGKQPLGSIGHFGCFSFHETKNIISGEGGMLVVNDESFIKRSEIIWEKGTNRAEFFRGEVNKYGWVDTGSSFLPSELTSAFLFAQLENLELIQSRRIDIWNRYFENLKNIPRIKLPSIQTYATNNGHCFYILFESLEERTRIINKLKENGIMAVFHYLPLHNSEFNKINKTEFKKCLPNCECFSDCLLRLPLYYELSNSDIDKICKIIVDEICKK